MVAVKKNFKTNKDLWWAYSPVHGWVVLDKTLPQNINTYCPEEFQFLRGRDGAVYEQGEEIWDYKEASRYLDTLPAIEAMQAEKELLAVQQRFQEQLAA